jgi:hypothetical protein
MGNNPFLAVSPDGSLLAVTAAVPGVGSPTGLQILLYRTSDWSLEQSIPAPNLIQYFGPAAGVEFSSDGTTLLAFQYEIPPGGTGDDAVYWLGVYDIASQSWVRRIDLPGCYGIDQMIAGSPDRVDVLCGGFLHEVDWATGTIENDLIYRPSIAAFTIGDDTLYAVSDTRAIFVQPVGQDDTAARELDGSRVATALSSVPLMPLGLSVDRQFLAIPTTDASDTPVTDVPYASRIVVIDLESDSIARTIVTSSPFRQITFSPDGTLAYVTLLGAEGSPSGLARIDLGTGAETLLATGSYWNPVVR